MANPGNTNDKIRRVQEIFLESIEGLAESPENLVAAVNYGLDRVVDQLLRQACAEVGIPAEDFSRALEDAPAVQQQLQQKVAALFTPEAVQQAKVEAQRKDAERHLHVLRFVLSGTEPPPWVWQSVDPDEQARIRAFRQAGGEDDPELLGRVENALGKFGAAGGYGICEGCGKAILTDRLGLIPYAERCTTCQRELEAPEKVAATAPRVPFFMFFEGGRPVPKEQQLVDPAATTAHTDSSPSSGA